MAKLPFVVQPRLKPIVETIGTEDSGKFEIERRGYLTVAEKAFVQGATAGDTALADLHALASKIARKHGIQAVDVFQILLGAAQDEFGYLEDFENEVGAALTNLLSYQEKHKLIVATCLLNSRVDGDWTPDDTMTLHPDIIDDLMALYNDEDRKSIAALEAAAADEAAAAGEEGKE